MPEQEPRCPYCFTRLSFLAGEARRDRIRNAPIDCEVLACANFKCRADLSFVGDCKADCVHQASKMKLVDRKVCDAVEAEREVCAKLIEGCVHLVETPEWQAIIKAIRAREKKGKSCPKTS